MTDERYSFTWGAALEGFGYVEIYNFMLHHYIKLGVTRTEMLLIAHLASYRYNVAHGESRPSRATIAKQMGYSKADRIDPLIKGLEKKGLLAVTRRKGHPSVYNFSRFAEGCLKLEMTEGSAAELAVRPSSPETGATSSPETEATVAPKRGPKESYKNEVSKTKLPAQQTAQVNDGGPEYVEIDSDGVPLEDSEPKAQGWQIPELPIHFQVLAVRGGKLFHQHRLKSRLTGLAQAMAAGDVLGDGVYQACVDGLNGKEKLEEPLPPVPASWLPWRLEHARRGRWSVEGTVSALFARDRLVTHCHYHLKKMGASVPQPALEEREFPGATTYE